MLGILSGLFRPSRVPYFAVMSRATSELKLVNLEGGSSSSVKIADNLFLGIVDGGEDDDEVYSDNLCLGIVTNDGEVYAVTEKEILKLSSDGRKTILWQVGYYLDEFSQVVSFQKKIYIIQPDGKSILCFDPADSSLTDDLPGCGLGFGLCASATDDFIYAMGGDRTETLAMKYDPLTITWEETKPMWNGRNGAAAATLDGKIYVMGGANYDGSVEYYNPGNNSWKEISSMNTDRDDFTAFVVGDQLYAVGGDIGLEKKKSPQHSLEVYGLEKKKSPQHSLEVYDLEKIKSPQHSLEVYDGNKWTVVTDFETNDYWIYSCFWPHDSCFWPGLLEDETDSNSTTDSDDESVSKSIAMEGQLEDRMDSKAKITYKENDDESESVATSEESNDVAEVKTETSEEASTSGTGIVISSETSLAPEQSVHETKPESTTSEEVDADCGAVVTAAKLSAEIKRRIKTESTKSKSIGAAGGVLVNFGSKVTFSREAYNKDTKVQTSVITDFSDCPEDKVPIAPSIKCSPSGKLNKPALVEIDHWAFPTSGNFYVDIYWKDDENSERRFFKKVRIEGNRKISFHTEHFTIYEFFVKCALWVRDKVMRPFFLVAVQNHVYISGTKQIIVCTCCLKDEKVKDDVIKTLESRGFVPLLPLPETTHANCGEEVKIAIKCIQPRNLGIIPNDSEDAEPIVREGEEKFPIDEISEKCQKSFYLRIGLKEGDLSNHKGLLAFLYSHTAGNDKVTNPMSTPWPIAISDTQPAVAQHQVTTNITAKNVSYGKMEAADFGATNRITSESQTGNETSEQNVRQQGGATSNVTAGTYNAGRMTSNQYDTTTQVFRS